MAVRADLERVFAGLAGQVATHVRIEQGQLWVEFGTAAALAIGASWRVESATQVHARDTGLLVGGAVASAEVAAPAGDLVLRFRSGLRLRVFCDRRGAVRACDWTLRDPEDEWMVGPHGTVTREGGLVMSQPELVEQLSGLLSALGERRCWCAVPLGPRGAVQLGFGKKLARALPLMDEALPEDFRESYPEFGIFVECTWRLDSEAGVVCGPRDAMVQDGRLARGLARLVEQGVEAAELAMPAGDLVVRFRRDGLVLRLFCDRSAAEAGEDNWTLFVPHERFVVGPGGRIRHEKEPGGGFSPLRVVK